MDAPVILMWLAVIAAAGFAFRNLTAAALVLAWMAGTAVGIRTGDPLPIWFFPYADIAAFALIMCKDERTLGDRTVLALFPLCWLFYVAPIPRYDLFYALWAITLTQFLAVGWETALPFIRRFAETVIRRSDHSGTMLVPAYRGRGYG